MFFLKLERLRGFHPRRFVPPYTGNTLSSLSAQGRNRGTGTVPSFIFHYISRYEGFYRAKKILF